MRRQNFSEGFVINASATRILNKSYLVCVSQWISTNDIWEQNVISQMEKISIWCLVGAFWIVFAIFLLGKWYLIALNYHGTYLRFTVQEAKGVVIALNKIFVWFRLCEKLKKYIINLSWNGSFHKIYQSIKQSFLFIFFGGTGRIDMIRVEFWSWVYIGFKLFLLFSLMYNYYQLARRHQ